MAVENTKYKWKTLGLGSPGTAYSSSEVSEQYSVNLNSIRYYNDPNNIYVKYVSNPGSDPLYSYGWASEPLPEYKQNKTPILAKYGINMPMPKRQADVGPHGWLDLKGASYTTTISGDTDSTTQMISISYSSWEDETTHETVSGIWINGNGLDIKYPNCSTFMLELQAAGGSTPKIETGEDIYSTCGAGGGAYAFLIINLLKLSTKRICINNSAEQGIYIYLNTQSAIDTSSNFILVGRGKNSTETTVGLGGTVSTSGSLFDAVNILQQHNGGNGGLKGSYAENQNNGQAGNDVNITFLSYPLTSTLTNQSTTGSPGTFLGYGGTGGLGGSYTTEILPWENQARSFSLTRNSEDDGEDTGSDIPEEPVDPEEDNPITIHNLGKLKISSWDAESLILCLSRVDEQEIPLVEGQDLYTFEYRENSGFYLGEVLIDLREISFTATSLNISLSEIPTNETKLKVLGNLYNDELQLEYSIQETTFEYDSENNSWNLVEVEEPEQPEEPEPIVYTTYYVNEILSVDGKSSDSCLYLYPESQDEQFPEGDSDNIYLFRGESGSGIYINDEQVLVETIKQPGTTFYIKFYGIVRPGDILTINGTYYCEATAKEFVFNNCKLMYKSDNTWAQLVSYNYEFDSNNNDSDQLEVASNSTAKELYLKVAGEENPISINCGYREFIPQGTCIILNDAEVSGINLKQPQNGNIYFNFGSLILSVNDFLLINGSFYNEILDSTITIKNYILKRIDSAPYWEIYIDEAIGDNYVDKQFSGLTPVFGFADTLYVKPTEDVPDGYYMAQFVPDPDSENVLTVNGEPCANVTLTKLLDHLQIKFDQVSAGQFITIKGTFICEDKKLKYTFNKVRFKWTGRTWVDAPIEYLTTYTIGGGGGGASVLGSGLRGADSSIATDASTSIPDRQIGYGGGGGGNSEDQKSFYKGGPYLIKIYV